MYVFFFFKQKTAYEMRISDWSSDVCSSDLCRASAWEAGRGCWPWSFSLDCQRTGANHVPAAYYKALRPCPSPRVCYSSARPARACEAARDFVHPAGNTCGRGGIGRASGFKYQYPKIWGFESLSPQHYAKTADNK